MIVLIGNPKITFNSFKAECAGKIVEQINPKGTSQNCSGCDSPVPKDLSVRDQKVPQELRELTLARVDSIEP